MSAQTLLILSSAAAIVGSHLELTDVLALVCCDSCCYLKCLKQGSLQTSTNVQGVPTTVLNNVQTHLDHSPAHATVASGWPMTGDPAMVRFK